MADPAGSHVGDPDDAVHLTGDRMDLIDYPRLDAVQNAGDDHRHRFPHQAQDRDRDDEPGDRVRQGIAEADAHGYDEHGEARPPSAARVVAVGDERRAADLLADPDTEERARLVSHETYDRGGDDRAQVGDRLRMNETLDRLVRRHGGARRARQAARGAGG